MYPVDVSEVAQISREEVRQQIETICASHSFRTRESFRKLLMYLAERTLEGSAESLKEYTVGVELFGKAATYDPRDDAAVRVAVSKLRQKLEEYYLGEGKEDRLIIELPRRQFALSWRLSPTASEPNAVAARPLPPERKERRTNWQLIIAGGIALLIGILVWRPFSVSPALATASSRTVPAEVEQFWRPVFADGRPVLASLGTPMFVRMHGLRVRAGHEDIEAARADSRIRKVQSLFGSPNIQASYIYTGVGEATAAFELAKLFTRWDVDLQLRRNASLTWEEISNHNLIILGSAKYNPHIRELPVQQCFLVEQGGVKNLRPTGGEPSLYERRYDKDPDRSIIQDYAVISRLPGVNGRGTIVVLGASATEGTAAAVDFVTHAASLRQLFEKMKGNSGEPPKYFEAVVKVEFRAMVPVRTHYQTHRVVGR